MLGGTLTQREPLRHTPAGVPLLRFRLQHESAQLEAGIERRVECEVAGQALGAAAVSLSASRDGESLRVTGFLARQSRNSTQLVMHVNNVEIL